MDWRKGRDDLRRNIVPQHFPAQTPLPLRVATSRAGGFNPTRVYFNGMWKQQFDIHPQTDPIRWQFFSQANIDRLQDECERRGFGRPAPRQLVHYMNLALVHDRGLFNEACTGNGPEWQQLQAEFLAHLNEMTMAQIQYVAPGIKFGYEQYYRDINQIRNIPPHPQFREPCAKNSDIPIEFTHYHGLPHY